MLILRIGSVWILSLPRPWLLRMFSALSEEIAKEIAAKLLCCSGPATFEPGKIKPETQIAIGKIPDLTIEDRDGNVRAFIENKFWADLTPAQPVDYLNALPEDVPASLLFVMPERRMPSVWQELKHRCGKGGIALGNEGRTAGGQTVEVKGTRRNLQITSWRHALDLLDQAAEGANNSALTTDIHQLRGLVLWQEAEGVVEDWTVLEIDHGIDRYMELTLEIVNRLACHPRVDRKGLTGANTPYWRGRYLRVDSYGMGLGIVEGLWRHAGMTPVSCRLMPNAWGGLEGQDWASVQALFADDGAQDDGHSIYIPIQIKTGSEETTLCRMPLTKYSESSTGSPRHSETLQSPTRPPDQGFTLSGTRCCGALLVLDSDSAVLQVPPQVAIRVAPVLGSLRSIAFDPIFVLDPGGVQPR